MKCNNCGSEWSASSKYSQISSCPFCGSSLMNIETSSKEITMSKIIKLIFQQFGIDIILQKNKFLSIFLDYAPKLKKEKKILYVALDENVADFFVNCEIEERETNIQKARRKMDWLMSESAIDLVISSFIDALEWDGLDINCAKTNDVVLEEKNYATNYRFNSAEDFFHIVQGNIIKIQKNGTIFDREHYEKECKDSRYVHACQMLNNENYLKAYKCFERLLYPDSTNLNKIGSALAGLKLAQMYYWGDGIDINKKEAARVMVSLINTGNPLIIAWISNFYRTAIPNVTVKSPEFSKMIYDICIKELKLMADLGDPDAQYFLGFNLIYGIHCNENENAGFAYVKLSSEAKNMHSSVLLARCYIKGYGTDKDIAKGVHILLNFEGTICPTTQYHLGLLYYMDKYQGYLPKNDTRAFKYFLSAATCGHISAQDYVGDMYYYGYGVETDYKIAKQWYELASVNGNIHSISQLGKIYYYGKSVSEDEDKAFHYFKTAADKGNVYSQYMLHVFYFIDGKYKNYELGRQYLEKAANKGDIDSQKLLARMYVSELGFNDDSKFMYWIRKATEQGDNEAEMILGESYIKFNNKVLPKDYNKARVWLEKATGHGNIDAMVYLSELYSNGVYVSVDSEKVDKLVSAVIDLIKNKSIEEDKVEEFNERIARIMFNIGKYYWNSKQKELSFRYFGSSWLISDENSKTSKMITQCYKYGIGVKKDRKKAKLYSKLS